MKPDDALDYVHRGGKNYLKHEIKRRTILLILIAHKS